MVSLIDARAAAVPYAQRVGHGALVLAAVFWASSASASPDGSLRPDRAARSHDATQPESRSLPQDAGAKDDSGPGWDAITEPMAISAPEDESRPDRIPESMTPLPGIEPDPALAPIVNEWFTREPSTRAIAPAERPRVLIKTILGLIALFVLAYLGGHPRVQKWEETLKVSQLITAGFPFVILGMAVRHPSVGILTDEVLAELGPLLRLGLGWIGFGVGFRFDVSLLGKLGSGLAPAIGWGALTPFTTVLGASGVLLLFWNELEGASMRDPVFIRDAIILGTAGVVTSWTIARLLPRSPGRSAIRQLVRLEELVGILGLAVVAAYFRPQGAEVSWQLPGTAWLLLTVGLGVTVGIVVYAILQIPSDGPEFAVLTIGSISLTAGIAGYLHLSSVVVAFVAGAFLGNLPGAYKETLGRTLRRLERPIYLVSLLVIGALWRIDEPLGWALMAVFAGSRIAGNWMGVQLGTKRGAFSLAAHERKLLVIAPMGELAIVIVVNAQLLYPGGSISAIVSAVIGGAILSEVFVQIVSRRAGLMRPEDENQWIREDTPGNATPMPSTERGQP